MIDAAWEKAPGEDGKDLRRRSGRSGFTGSLFAGYDR